MSYLANSLQTINVKNFGAQGNGVTNERHVIQSAINSLQSRNVPGTIYFPPGTYLFSGTLDVTGQNIAFLGYPGSILRSYPDETAKKFNISGAKNITFEGLELDANRQSAPQNTNQNGFISTLNSENLSVTNCSLGNTRDSMIYLGGGTKFARIVNNVFTGHFCGIYGYVNSGEMFSEGFIISDNVFGTSWIAPYDYPGESACIKLQTFPGPIEQGGYTGISRGHSIVGNVINSSTQIGIELWSKGRNSIISDNYVSNTAWGISCDNQQYCVISNNTCKQIDYYAIECASICRDVTVSNNKVDGYSGVSSTVSFTEVGILTSNTASDGIIINGNTVEGCAKGVQVQPSINTIISNNILRDNAFNLMFQGSSLSTISENIFISTSGNVVYHIFFDSSTVNQSGFHLIGNVFRGVTTNQSIFYFNGEKGQTGTKLFDLCVENNVTDGSTSGNYGNFIGGEYVPVNYIYRNNFSVTGGVSDNSILNATDNPPPYDPSLINQGISYYGSNYYTIPSGGVTGLNGVGSGIWLCIWSGGGGSMNNVRVRAQYDNDLGNNSSLDMEAFASMYPYNLGLHGLTIMPQAHFSTSLISRVHTQSHDDGTPTNSIWVKVEVIGTGAYGNRINFEASTQNKLNAVYSTYDEPLWANNTTSLPANQNVQTIRTNGVSIGDGFAFTSTASGAIAYDGILTSDGFVQKYNYYDGMVLNSGIAVSYLSGTSYNPQNTTEMDSAFLTGIFSSALVTGTLAGITVPFINSLVEVKGYFYASGSGQYSFGLNCDDAGDLFIDGKLMAYWYGSHSSGTGPNGTQNTTYLNQGFHRFYSRLQQGGGGTVLQCWVRSPVDTGYYVIPSASLYYGQKDCWIPNKIGGLNYIGSAPLVLSNFSFNTATSATANGGGTTLPTHPVGFFTMNITGSSFKIPYYNI